MRVKLTEWEAWATLAMGGVSHMPGICSAISHISCNRDITTKTHLAMMKRMQKIRNTGSYWWQTYNWAPRTKFCWKMAKQCDKENVA